MDLPFEEWVSVSTQYPAFKVGEPSRQLGLLGFPFDETIGEIVNDLVTAVFLFGCS
jgi:hypothetical protein